MASLDLTKTVTSHLKEVQAASQAALEARGKERTAKEVADNAAQFAQRITQAGAKARQADTQRAIQEEMQKRKEKMAKEKAKAEGKQYNPLEGLSETSPINGDPGRSSVRNIGNVQKGMGKTGPGGTLTANSSLGSQAFNMPDTITSTSQETTSGDLGQRGALIRQGPVSRTTTETRPNVLTAGDALQAHQRANEFEQTSAQRASEFSQTEGRLRKQFDAEIDLERTRTESMIELNNTQMSLAQNRDTREGQIHTANINETYRAFDTNLRTEFSHIPEPERNRAAEAFKNGDMATLNQVTRTWGLGVTEKMKRAMDQSTIDKNLAEVESLQASAAKDRFYAGVLNDRAVDGSYLSGSGLSHNFMLDALDPKSINTLHDDVAALTTSAIKDSEFLPQHEAALQSIQQRKMAAGKVFILAKTEKPWATDPDVFRQLDLPEIGLAMEIYGAALDSENPLLAGADEEQKKAISAEATKAKQILINSGLAMVDPNDKNGGLTWTPQNEIPFKMVKNGAMNVWKLKKSNYEVNQVRPPTETAVPPVSREVDRKAGIPLSAQESRARNQAKLREVLELTQGYILGKYNLSEEEYLELKAKEDELRNELRLYPWQVINDHFANRQLQERTRNKAAKKRANEVLRGKTILNPVEPKPSRPQGPGASDYRPTDF